MVLDMGEPVRILDVAKRFSSLYSPALEIVYTGLRKGEKLHEDLIASDEDDVRPIHPLITHVPVPPLSIDQAVEVLTDRRAATGWAIQRAAFVGTPHDVMA